MIHLNKEEMRVLAQDAYADPVLFCGRFLSHLFPTEIPWLHRGILAILTHKADFLLKYGDVEKIIRNFVWKDENDKEHAVFEQISETEIKMHLGRFTLIMLPRGSAKTTIAGVAVPVYNIVYQNVPFGMYVSEAGEHAAMQLTNIKFELTDNEMIQAVFGNLKPNLKDEKKWTETFFETITGIAMSAKGRGGQVRGRLHKGRRPHSIIIDDIEDLESVATEEQRNKTRVWFFGDLMPALSKLDASATVTALGTLLHSDALLARLSKDPRWTTVKFSVQDVDGEYWWPEYMDAKKVEDEKASYARQGLLSTFYLEYYNQSRNPETAVIKEEWFKYNPQTDDLAHTAIYIDPAISPNRKADKTAIIVAGMTKKGIIRFLEVKLQRGMDEGEKTDLFFEWSKKWKCMRHGIESNAYQAALVHRVREEMFRKKHYFEIQAVTHKTRKIERIKQVLKPRMASGYIEFRIRWPELEIEMLDLRGDTNDQPDDGSDACAGVISLLDPYAAQAAGDVDLSEDQYGDIEDDVGGNWRLA